MLMVRQLVVKSQSMLIRRCLDGSHFWFKSQYQLTTLLIGKIGCIWVSFLGEILDVALFSPYILHFFCVFCMIFKSKQWFNNKFCQQFQIVMLPPPQQIFFLQKCMAEKRQYPKSPLKSENYLLLNQEFSVVVLYSTRWSGQWKEKEKINPAPSRKMVWSQHEFLTHHCFTFTCGGQTWSLVPPLKGVSMSGFPPLCMSPLPQTIEFPIEWYIFWHKRLTRMKVKHWNHEEKKSFTLLISLPRIN